MKTRESPLFSALPASAAAGPIFVLSFSVAQAFSFLPHAIPIDGGILVAILIAILPSAIAGFVISFVPNAIGAYVLSIAGETSETAREPVVWMGVGGALGLLFAIIFGAFDSIAVTLSLIATSIACAALCRARTRWED